MTDRTGLSIEILYQSNSCLAVLKPAGLATQAPPQFDSLESRLRAWLTECQPERPFIYLGVPHRLDRPVSGAMVFATRRRAAFKLSRQFERREVQKLYWALVQGEVEPAAGVWTDSMRKVYGKPRSEIVPAEHPQAQIASLSYRTLGRSSNGSWLEIELHTGRTHQIRLQAASRGHAVLGDAFYGSTTAFGSQHADERLRAIALHARRLSFGDPATRQPVTVEAPLSTDWNSIVG
jgi:23S rRNA pseudouridine1911/1915/1917 synthase